MKQINRCKSIFLVNFLLIYHRAACVFCLYVQISPEGVVQRDEKVFQFAREKNIPIVMLTSGLLLQVYSQLISVLPFCCLHVTSHVSDGFMKSSAGVIADSIVNLSKRCLIQTSQDPTSS